MAPGGFEREREVFEHVQYLGNRISTDLITTVKMPRHFGEYS